MTDRENRAPGRIWALRRPGMETPNGFVWTLSGDRVAIAYDNGEEPDGPLARLVLPRSEARLLAKRLNECLDETNL